MRRIIDRSFPRSESKKEDDPDAIKFREFLRTDLKWLKALGDFRNWYIINHQAEILDDRRPPPLDLGYNILKEAYKMVGREAPEWTGYRLPENQLQESMEDNTVLVKRAFEKYIDEQVNRAVPIWRAKLARDRTIRSVRLHNWSTQKTGRGQSPTGHKMGGQEREIRVPYFSWDFG